jgi:hypothetical protein
MALAVLLGVIGSLIAAELYLWLSALATRLIRYEASRLPRQSDRMLEQWTADLDEFPGHFAKFSYAVSLLVKHRRIVRELPTVIVPAVFSSAGAGSVGFTGHAPALTISVHESIWVHDRVHRELLSTFVEPLVLTVPNVPADGRSELPVTSPRAPAGRPDLPLDRQTVESILPTPAEDP